MNFDIMEFVYEIERLKAIEFAYEKLVVKHEKLEKEFQEMFENNMRHSQTMAGGFLKLALDMPENIKAFGDKK